MARDAETIDPPADLEVEAPTDGGDGPDADRGHSEGSEDTETELGELAKPGPNPSRTGSRWTRIVAYGLLPAAVMLLGAAAGFFCYRNQSDTAADQARTASVKTATDDTIALLSYQPDTADKTLNDSRDRLTGNFRDAYSSLIHNVVIPGAKQKHISSVATVPAAASVSASGRHAVVLVFVNQSVIVGSDAPTATTSCVKVGLDKVGDRWLISKFDPV